MSLFEYLRPWRAQSQSRSIIKKITYSQQNAYQDFQFLLAIPFATFACQIDFAVYTLSEPITSKQFNWTLAKWQRPCFISFM